MTEEENLQDLKDILVEKLTPIFKDKGSYSEGVADGIMIVLDVQGLDKLTVKTYLTEIIKGIEETKQ